MWWVRIFEGVCQVFFFNDAKNKRVEREKLPSFSKMKIKKSKIFLLISERTGFNDYRVRHKTCLNVFEHGVEH